MPTRTDTNNHIRNRSLLMVFSITVLLLGVVLSVQLAYARPTDRTVQRSQSSQDSQSTASSAQAPSAPSSKLRSQADVSVGGCSEWNLVTSPSTQDDDHLQAVAAVGPTEA